MRLTVSTTRCKGSMTLQEHAGALMARFQICLMGGGAPPVMETRHSDLQGLADDMARSRFIAGELVDTETGEIGPKVLVAVCRIQMILEAD